MDESLDRLYPLSAFLFYQVPLLNGRSWVNRKDKMSAKTGMFWTMIGTGRFETIRSGHYSRLSMTSGH